MISRAVGAILAAKHICSIVELKKRAKGHFHRKRKDESRETGALAEVQVRDMPRRNMYLTRYCGVFSRTTSTSEALLESTLLCVILGNRDAITSVVAEILAKIGVGGGNRCRRARLTSFLHGLVFCAGTFEAHPGLSLRCSCRRPNSAVPSFSISHHIFVLKFLFILLHSQSLQQVKRQKKCEERQSHVSAPTRHFYRRK